MFASSNFFHQFAQWFTCCNHRLIYMTSSYKTFQFSPHNYHLLKFLPLATWHRACNMRTFYLISFKSAVNMAANINSRLKWWFSILYSFIWSYPFCSLVIFPNLFKFFIILRLAMRRSSLKWTFHHALIGFTNIRST